MQDLFKINPSFSNLNQATIIYGTGRIALLAHTVALQENIYIEAFCAEENNKDDIPLMNKPIISFEELIANRNQYKIIVATDDVSSGIATLESNGISNYWVDLHMYSIINDCVWAFM